MTERESGAERKWRKVSEKVQTIICKMLRKARQRRPRVKRTADSEEEMSRQERD